MMRRNDFLVPGSVVLFGLAVLSGLFQVSDRFVSLEARLVRLEVGVSRLERALEYQERRRSHSSPSTSPPPD